MHDNHVHDIQSFGYGGWGLYTDEGSTDIVMERNLVHHTKTGGFFQHFGKENRIQNNIFAFGTQFQLEGTRPESHVSFHFERNIVFWDNNSPLLGGCHSASVPCEINFKLDHNLYWNAAGKPPVFPGNLNLGQWRERNQDRHSLVADPLFADAKSGNFQLQSASPALERRVPALRCDEGGPARASLADHGLANCASGIPIRTYRFRGRQQRRRAPAGACDAGPAKFTIITDGNNLFATSGPRSRHARARRRRPNRITPLLH